MELVNTETGEILEPLTKEEAERLTMRISLKLDSMADAYAGVMPLIRQAIDGQAHAVLGYTSVTAYVSDRFGGALTKLGVDMRREVVRELTEAGMSTRAIAPIVGVSNYTVHQDQKAGVRDLTPAEAGAEDVRQAPSSGQVSYEADEDDTAGDLPLPSWMTVPTEDQVDNLGQKVSEPAPLAPVIGLDGKRYTKATAPKKPNRKPLPDTARDAGWEIRKSVERLTRITQDDRFGSNKEQVATHLRGHLQYAIEVCQDLLDRIDN